MTHELVAVYTQVSTTPVQAKGCFFREWHGHVHYVLINIPRTKKLSIRELETLYGQDNDEFGGSSHDTESILTVKSNIARFCDFQMAFMWLLRAT